MDLGEVFEPDSSIVLQKLLSHIALDSHERILLELLENLDPDNQSDIDLFAALLGAAKSASLRDQFVAFLERLVAQSSVQPAIVVSKRFPALGQLLLYNALDYLNKAKSSSKSSSHDAVLQSYLLFCKQTILCVPVSDIHVQLLRTCLALLPGSTHELQTALKEFVFEVLAIWLRDESNGPMASCQDAVWECTQILLASKNKSHISTGYSLWLRWLLHANGTEQRSLNTSLEVQTSLVLQGLRHGDSEQRKMCLNILRLAMTADDGVVPANMRNEYDRYATVFETIVLGRYTNQVMECKHDLDFLASRSQLDPHWLYTMLGPALENRMQESNRKLIGNWVMETELKPGAAAVEFLEHDFLPWATQGQHFVATLKRVEERTICVHGERLAAFIKRVRSGSENPQHVTNIVVEAIMRRRNSMFAHCTVFLLDGLEDSLSDQQKADLTKIRGLPEVARDYLALKTTRAMAEEDSAMSVRQSKEQQAFDKLMDIYPDLETLDDLWTDIEYLEFPKKLILVLPVLLLDSTTMWAAAADPKLVTKLLEWVEVLQQIATTKTYLFPPLMTGLRKAVFAEPQTVNVLDLHEILARVAEQPPEPTPDLMLEEAIIPLTPNDYWHYFGERRSYGYAAYIDLVSRLQKHQDLLKGMIERILRPWTSQKVPPLTVSPWKNALQLQVLLLCFEQYRPSSSKETESLLGSLYHILAIEPLPGYRYLLEAIVVRMLMRHDLAHTVIERLKSKDHHSNSKHLASLMKIGTILACSPASDEQFAEQLAITFVPLAASSKIVIRHEAQWQIPILLEHARLKQWTLVTGNHALQALDEYIRSLERFSQPPLEKQIGRFDPAKDLTLANLVEGRWFDLDSIQSPLTSYDDLAELYDRVPLTYAPASCIPLGPPIERPGLPFIGPLRQEEIITPPPGLKDPTDVVTTALQTKGTAYLARSLSTTPTTRPHENLLVVASLVDNPYNLGGLSRVSEIFGAGALTIQNQNAVSNKDFLSVAVSSHLHFPIIQLSTSAMVEWLREKKAEGYTVVGIEQTDRSVMLGSTEARLPEKCCLVVGSEREGIPADVLIECGLLVEIEQKGVTRSLNVQTAVGIVLFEYGRQFGGTARVG